MEMQNSEYHHLGSKEETTHILEEARMIIPGIQAIFGFQLIAVFSEGFATKLENHHEVIHLLAMVLSLVSMAFLMSPAAYQRRIEPRNISASFVNFSSKMIKWGLGVLTVSLAADMGVIAYAVTEKEWVSVFLSLATLSVLVWLWFLIGSPHSNLLGYSALNMAHRHMNDLRTNFTEISRRHFNKVSSAVFNAGFKYFN